MKLLKHYMVLVFVLCAANSFAQTEINVVTKSITKVFLVDSKDKIELNAIKANIKLVQHGKNEVKVVAKLISKNKDLDLAKKELSYISCSVIKNNKAVRINNIFTMPGKDYKVSSMLQVNYTIYTPANIPIEVTNKYGLVEAINLNCQLGVDLAYGELKINGLAGSGNITTKFTKINAERLSGNFNFTSENSQFHITNMNGNYMIRNTTGNLYFAPGNNLKKLTVEASFSNVIIKTSGFNQFNYTLRTEYAEIQLPQNLVKKESLIINSPEKIKYTSSDMNPHIQVTTSFKAIKVE